MTWLDTAGAAAYLKRNPDDIRRMAKSGQIPAHRVQPVKRADRPTKARGTWRYDTNELDAWVRGEQTTPGPRRITTGPRRTA